MSIASTHTKHRYNKDHSTLLARPQESEANTPVQALTTTFQEKLELEVEKGDT